jgi:hypothetical protein
VAGVADTVICIRAHLRQEQRFFVAGAGDASRPTGELALRAPYGVPAGWAAICLSGPTAATSAPAGSTASAGWPRRCSS